MWKIGYVLFLLPILFTLVSCSNKDNSFTIDDVDIQAQIAEDGTIHVKELYSYTFNDSNQKVTRQMASNIENFQAYVASDRLENAEVKTANLEPLKVDKDHEEYHVNFVSDYQPKQIIYSYTIDGAVTKHNDMADFSYSFFDTTQTDLHNVTVNLYTPSNQLSDDTHFFFHSHKQPSQKKTDGRIHYQHDLVSQSESYPFRLLFPANELTSRPVDQATNIKNVLVSESSLQWRYQNIEENFNSKTWLVVISMILTLLAGFGLFYFRPNKKKGTTLKEALLSSMEKTDPLLVKYVDNDGKLAEEDVIAGVFSLHQRGLISISDVPSELNAGNTFRFTWRRSQAKLAESDQYLKNWLFTNQDEDGAYFLLESMATPNKRKSIKTFNQNFVKWRQLVEEQPPFKEVNSPYLPYHLFSFSLVLITLGLLTYFVFFDVWSRGIQYSVITFFTIFGSIVLFFKCHKVLMAILFAEIFLLSVFLSMTTATALFLVFIIIAGSLSFLIPSSKYKSGTNELQIAIKLAKKLLKTNHYPMGNTAREIQKQMQYAIILQEENKFAKNCSSIPPTLLKSGNYPLLNDPRHTASAFDASLLLTGPFIDRNGARGKFHGKDTSGGANAI
ncbi:DUF2207 domain-containing protein [Aquibacillus saliphilus]|uniref:DUF2207 domain-containing protein n=1 Tax=Aquibacillus saliphilus TaxID=1909422 RepID=UPI001CEFDD1F|nr:DUF2207 domain-containing protein [Aquibacillus saliphilus]